MGNRSQREILIENQIYLAGLDKDGFQVWLFRRNPRISKEFLPQTKWSVDATFSSRSHEPR